MRLDNHDVPLLTASEGDILALYNGLGRDMNGRALVAEEEAMLGRLRRLGWKFSDLDILECWAAIANEEAKYRAERAPAEGNP